MNDDLPSAKETADIASEICREHTRKLDLETQPFLSALCKEGSRLIYLARDTGGSCCVVETTPLLNKASLIVSERARKQFEENQLLLGMNAAG